LEIVGAKSPLHQLPPHFLQKVSNSEQTADEPTTETVWPPTVTLVVKYAGQRIKSSLQPRAGPLFLSDFSLLSQDRDYPNNPQLVESPENAGGLVYSQATFLEQFKPGLKECLR
jgi:hypothetical protein